MERIGEFILAAGGMYLVILLFVMMGSRNFFSGRTIVADPAAVAAVIWVIAILVIFWNAYWGRNAGIAFVGLLTVVAAAIAGLVAWLNRKS